MIIGLDVGGTHTDVVLLDNAGLLREVKVPTDASDLFRSVLKSLGADPSCTPLKPTPVAPYILLKVLFGVLDLQEH